jgi:hypothetical protein
MVVSHSAFDRVAVVNLARRPERMARFWQSLGQDWPFQTPARFEAIDGTTVPAPPDWQQGAGAWGCMLSHRQLIRSAIADNLDSILILEDDAVPVTSFSGKVTQFLDHVPADWDCLMLGGQHLTRPEPVAPGVVRCTSTNRTHAFAVRRTMMPGLLRFWESVTNDHCDIVLAACMAHFKAYAPNPFLIGQTEGFSDITLERTKLRFLSPADRLALTTKAA